MMSYTALVPPRRDTVGWPGGCLPYAQSFFGAPVRWDSAWEAWEATAHKHSRDEPLPADAPVLLWYSHQGTYWVYSQGRYRTGEWGHVTPHIPGEGIYTSPGDNTSTREIWSSIRQIEQRFACTYVGWSEDINGLRIAQPGEEDEMTPDQANKFEIMFKRLENMENSAIIEARRNVNMEGAIRRLGTAVAGVADILAKSSGSPEAAAIAKAVESALADDFAAIPGAVANEQAERLKK